MAFSLSEIFFLASGAILSSSETGITRRPSGEITVESLPDAIYRDTVAGESPESRENSAADMKVSVISMKPLFHFISVAERTKKFAETKIISFRG